MTEVIKQSLRDSKVARWTALGIISITMFAGYMLTDIMSPLKGLLEEQLRWSSSEYGFFTSAYGWFNVFLLMLIIGGIILDKMGVRFTGLMAASVMVAGTAIKYWAISTHVLDDQVWHILWFDMKAQVFMMCRSPGGLSSISRPSEARIPRMFSVSTRFLGQPREV